MARAARTVTASSVQVELKRKAGHRSIVLALLAVVIVLDQATKWWAWRHVPGTNINDGGDVLVGTTVGSWYAAPVTGALLDLLDFGLLSMAVLVLVRRPRPAEVQVPGALMIAGWSSNLLDRLGMHYWTAPGSVRGAVDFIHIGHSYYNVADFFIIGATALFLLATSSLAKRATNRSDSTRSTAPTTHHRTRVRTSAFAGAAALVIGVTVIVGIGAAHYGVLTAPLT
jgi:lipoprotein signal peptidase